MIFNESNIIIPQTVEKGQDEILIDKSSSGRLRPWREKKLKSMQVAKAFKALGEDAKAVRCGECGNQLVFSECPHDKFKKLKGAVFCRERLCPTCSWRRSLRMMYEVSKVLHKAVELNPKYKWLLLTLTAKNIFSENLKTEIDDNLKGWNLLRKRRELKGIAGFFKTLEITHNDVMDNWHPHIHVLFAVKPSYFSDNYISQKRWRELWSDVMNLDYEPSVDIHAIKKRKSDNSLQDAIKEVGKYSVKDSDLLGKSEHETIDRVAVLYPALKNRQLISYGGELRKIARTVLKPIDENESLIHTSDEPTKEHIAKCPICGSDMLDHLFWWSMKRKNHIG